MATVYYGRLVRPVGLRSHGCDQTAAPAPRQGIRIRFDVHRRGPRRRARTAPQCRGHAGCHPRRRRNVSGHGAHLGGIAGAAHARLRDDAAKPFHRIAAALVSAVLHGLHAAHEATSASGAALHIVHRDVSPQNILVGAEGTARLIDFGVAKAVGRLQTTVEGGIKGKVAYMAPEQVLGDVLDRRTDIYAAGVVLWELLTGRRLIDAEPAAAMHKVLQGRIAPPTEIVPSLSKELDAVVMRALATDRTRRFGTARQMAAALESSTPVAGPIEVGEWVRALAGEALERRARVIADLESGVVLQARPRESSDPSLRDGEPSETQVGTQVSTSTACQALQADSGAHDGCSLPHEVALASCR